MQPLGRRRRGGRKPHGHHCPICGPIIRRDMRGHRGWQDVSYARVGRARDRNDRRREEED